MLKVGLIGLGWWGGSLLRMLQDNKVLKVVVATDVDPGRASVAQASGAAFVETFDQVLSFEGVQAVILCTPHPLHAQQAIAAARSGKHVFCEKPLTLTQADAVNVVSACRDAGVVLGVGHERRFEPPIVDLMASIASGELGTIVQIEGNFNQDKFLALPADNWRINGPGSVGPMTATGIHVLDLSTAVFGAATRVMASSRRLATSFENGDTLAVMVEFESGGVALISAVLTTPFDGRFAVYGSRGWVEVRDKSHPENSEGWVATYVVRGQDKRVVDYPGASAALLNLEAFGKAAVGQEPYPIDTGQMIETIAALEAVFKSAASNEPQGVGH
jgi:predicted dehydrogenase